LEWFDTLLLATRFLKSDSKAQTHNRTLVIVEISIEQLPTRTNHLVDRLTRISGRPGLCGIAECRKRRFRFPLVRAANDD
jgi:hypothetical protein